MDNPAATPTATPATKTASANVGREKVAERKLTLADIARIRRTGGDELKFIHL